MTSANRKPRLRIGTRRSDLARWQAEMVARRLQEDPEAPETEIIFIKTEGDRIVDVPLHAVDGKAFFTKEIEQALLEERIDLAVHSLKDLATQTPDGLAIGAVLEREDPRDILACRDPKSFEELPAGARIGTSSLRRRAQLARWRPDVEIVDLRGNVPTRIKKLTDGEYDGVVVAAAGVIRLGLTEHITQYLPTERVLPAVSQGAVGIEIRQDDALTRRWVERLDHPPTRQATAAERALLHRLEGGCQIPVGALATVEGDRIAIQGIVCSLDGQHAIEGSLEGSTKVPEQIGYGLAEDLLSRGAAEILESIRRAEQNR